MKGLILLFAVVIGAVLQAALPAPGWLGHAQPPVLLGLVIYYALLGTTGVLLAVALLAGLVEDTLGLMPLGYTAFAYCAAALAIRPFREVVMTRQWSTHALLGGAAAAALTVLLFVLLAAADQVRMGALALLARTAGGAVAGAVTAPLVFALLLRLERLLGLAPAEEHP